METKKVVLSLTKYLVFSVMLTGILLIIMSFLLYWFQLSDAIIQAGIIITYVVSCFFAGMMAGKRMKTKRLWYGLLMGVTYFVLLVVISVIVSKSQWTMNSDCVTVLLLCTAGGTLGGIVS